MTDDLIVFVLPRNETELLHGKVTELAETALDEASDEHDHRAAQALDHIADQIHNALYGNAS